METLPQYNDLPWASEHVRSGWGLFGEDDEKGLVNLLTPERVAAAASLITTGERFSLQCPNDLIDPPLFARGTTRRTILAMGSGLAFDDVYDNYYPQAGSQWDALAHYCFTDGIFYNGKTPEDVEKGKLGIHTWAESGIAGRGVLLDYHGFVGDRVDPWEPISITVDELEAVRKAQNVEIRTGDILLIRTGFTEAYAKRTLEHRREQASRRAPSAAGLENSAEMAEYLWNLHVSAIAMDNPGIEVTPPAVGADALPWGAFHRVLIGQFGLALGELWWLADLAQACREQYRWEFFLTSAPMHARGGVGSPSNALAIM